MQDESMSKDVLNIYNIITGKVKFKSKKVQDIDPDIIMRIKVPSKELINKSDFLSITHFMNKPSPNLDKAYRQGRKQIIRDMQQKNENNDVNSIKLRFQKALKKASPIQQSIQYQDEYKGIYERYVLQKIYQKNEILDIFTMQYNAIVYILQHQCGFKVNSYLIEDDNNKVYIFLFLNLNLNNRLKTAARYKIKKQLIYSNLDFYLNSPTSNDNRPISLHSTIRNNPVLIKYKKRFSRYFKLKDQFVADTQIIQQTDISAQELDNYWNFQQQNMSVLKIMKKMKRQLSDVQKQYIYKYNNQKINEGCKQLYLLLQKKRFMFYLYNYFVTQYSYQKHQQPILYQTFFIPNKKSIKSGFFQNLKNILLYRPTVSYLGNTFQIDLFSKMQKIKIAYLLLKQKFKLCYLKQIGIDIYPLHNQFQKKGNSQNFCKNLVTFTNLKQNWPSYHIGCNIIGIRNYFGDNIGHQISIQIYLFYYMALLSSVYTILFIIQQIYQSQSYIYTSMIQTLLFAFSFKVFLSFWEEQENQYINQFQNKIISNTFLSVYKGPYKRNPVTDEVNQYKTDNNLYHVFTKTIVIIVTLALFVILGSIFFGCRNLIIQLNKGMQNTKLNRISIPHALGYLLYFLTIQGLWRFLFNYYVLLLFKILNPATQQQYNQKQQSINFYTSFGIQYIPLVFLLLIEPFSGNSCYNNSCLTQLQYYIYAKYAYIIIKSVLSLSFSIIQKNKNKIKKQKKRKYDPTFSQRITTILLQAVNQGQMKEYKRNTIISIIDIMGFSVFISILPIVTMIIAGNIYINLTNKRIQLLHQQQRTIDKSEPINKVFDKMKIIYYIGLATNAWSFIFAFQIIQINYVSMIKNFVVPLTPEGIRLLKYICAAILYFILVIFGQFSSYLLSFKQSDSLSKRKRMKYKQYIESNCSIKLDYITKYKNGQFMKNIFRVANPLQQIKKKNNELKYKLNIKQISKNKKLNSNSSQKKLFHKEIQNQNEKQLTQRELSSRTHLKIRK